MIDLMKVKPTRSELLVIKRKIKLSETGHKLLKMKRDGLIMEFFRILSEAKDMRKKLIDLYRKADEKISIAECVDGAMAVRSAALARKSNPEIVLKTKNIMGVVVPQVEGKSVRKKIDERGYGLIGTSPRIDEAAEAYETLVDWIIKAAEIETTMRKILDEIERTKRRVNALEYRIIPGLKAVANFIAFRLEEMERDNISRLKHIKRHATTSATTIATENEF